MEDPCLFFISNNWYKYAKVYTISKLIAKDG